MTERIKRFAVGREGIFEARTFHGRRGRRRHSRPRGWDGYILEVEERSNHIVRPPIANIDQAFLLFSVKEPAFSYHLLDRFLVLIESKQVHPIIVLTKMDLLDESEQRPSQRAAATYRAIEYEVIETSTETRQASNRSARCFKERRVSLQVRPVSERVLYSMPLRLNLNLRPDYLEVARRGNIRRAM